MNKLRFGRMIPAMVTPFDGDGKVDFARAQELVERLIEGGSDSLIICGTTGESPTIKHADKLKLFSVCVEASNHKAPILANVGSNCTADSITLAQEAQKCGVEGLMTVVPYYNKPPQKGMYEHFKAIASSVELPIILYNIPGRCVVNMEAETTLALAHDCENIVAVKEASGKFDQIQHIINDAPDDFLVYSGDDAATLPIMKMGGVGVISTIGNVAPERMKEIVDLCAAGDFDEAELAHEKLLPLMNGLFETSNPILVKEAMRLTGFSVGGVRLPLVNATTEQSKRLESLMKEVGVIA